MSSEPTNFRTIDELAQLCGRCGWVETRLFELTGQWASGDGPAEWRLACSIESAQHAALASEWRARLPVRAGIDQEALFLPPPGPLAAEIEALFGQPVVEGMSTLKQRLLQDLVEWYRDELAVSSSVREASVMALLDRAIAAHSDVTGRELTPPQ